MVGLPGSLSTTLAFLSALVAAGGGLESMTSDSRPRLFGPVGVGRLARVLGDGTMDSRSPGMLFLRVVIPRATMFVLRPGPGEDASTDAATFLGVRLSAAAVRAARLAVTMEGVAIE